MFTSSSIAFKNVLSLIKAQGWPSKSGPVLVECNRSKTCAYIPNPFSNEKEPMLVCTLSKHSISLTYPVSLVLYLCHLPRQTGNKSKQSANEILKVKAGLRYTL